MFPPDIIQQGNFIN